MKRVALILGCISGLSFVTGVVSFLVWIRHFQLDEPTRWDVLFGVALGAFIVWLVSGWFAIGFLLASWVSRRSRQHSAPSSG
jgi:hypothetical protein